jgi:hypothetical protein
MNRPSVQDPPKPPRPGGKPSTSVRDDKRAIRIAVLTALIALVVVIAFNLKAPEDRLHAPGASPPAMPQGAQQTGGPQGDGTIRPRPQAARAWVPRLELHQARASGASRPTNGGRDWSRQRSGRCPSACMAGASDTAAAS